MQESHRKAQANILTEGNTPKAAASRTLRESFYAIRRMAAPGIDGVTTMKKACGFKSYNVAEVVLLHTPGKL
jgi:hypothetical protein